jgi:hypothetical protein
MQSVYIFWSLCKEMPLSEKCKQVAEFINCKDRKDNPENFVFGQNVSGEWGYFDKMCQDFAIEGKHAWYTPREDLDEIAIVHGLSYSQRDKLQKEIRDHLDREEK